METPFNIDNRAKVVTIDGQKMLLNLNQICLPSAFILDKRVIYVTANHKNRTLDVAVPSLGLTFSLTPDAHGLAADHQAEADAMIKLIREKIAAEIEKTKGGHDANN